MNNGTERDEPGQRGGDERQSPAESTSGPSSDPVWPVWGGAGAPEAADTTAPQDDESTDAEPATATVDDAAPEAVESGNATEPGPDAEPPAAAESADPAVDAGVDPEPDAAAATPADAAADAQPDVAAAAASDAAAEVELDAVADVEPDAASDAQPDVAADGAAAEAEPVAAAEAESDASGAAAPAAPAGPEDDSEVEADLAADAEAGSAGAAEADAAVGEPDGAEATGIAASADAVDAEEPDGDLVTDESGAPDEDIPGAAADAESSTGVDATASDAASETASSVDPTSSLADEPTGPARTDEAVETTEPADGGGAATEVIPPVAAAAAATTPATPAAATTTATPATPSAATTTPTPAATTATPAPASPPAPIGTLATPVTRTLPATAAGSAPTEPAEPAATAPVAAAVTASVAAAAAAAPAGAAAGPAAPSAPPRAASAAPASAAPTKAAPTKAAPAVTAPAVAAAASTAAAPSAPAPTAAAPTVPARISAGPVGSAPTAPRQAPIPSGPVPPSARKDSPLDVFEEEDGKRRWPKRLLIALGVVVVLAAAYVGASYALADRVPRGATVAGVDIGGLPSDEAVARLDEELADATTQPIEVVANDVQATIDPAAAGLTFDAQATVDQLTGVDLGEPVRLWQHLVGVGEHEPVTSVDEDALAAALSDLSTSLALAPVDGTIVFVDASAQSTDAVDGWNLDQAGAADVLSDDWLVAARPIELPTVAVEPDITQAETDAALVEAQKVTSAPVSVEVADQLALLDTATLAANASYVPTDGNLVLQMNGQGLSDAVLAQLPGLLTASADAHFEFVNDAPVIVPGTPGTSLDPAALATSVAAAATSGDRTAQVELVQADPSQSTAELEALGVKEIVSEFSTPLTSEPRRTVNITNGASKISGTLIRPGETFSLTNALGPIDAAHGFVEAGAIVSGEHTDAWGGGLSQISTTTYNAAFLAGFEDIEHRPHSEWFARYPEGREATIFTGTLDMRWKNNTPYGALVQAWVSGGRVYVRVWGTKYWTVESITSPRSGVVNPTTVYSQSPTCEASAAGNPGFSVTVTRKTSLNGELKKTESNSWRYKPQNKIICGPAPTPAATP